MVGVQIDPKSFNDFVKDLRKLGHVIASPNLQLYRAKKYRDYTQELVRRGQLDLEPLSEATRMLVGDHYPLSNTGTLVDMMGIRPVNKNEAEAGYFGANKSGKPNAAQLAILMHTGYKIPLIGEKGKRVRNWLMAHNIFVRHDKEYLIVKARPFLFISYFAYEFNGMDLAAVDEYINKLLNSPVESDGRDMLKGEMMSTGESGGENE